MRSAAEVWSNTCIVRRTACLVGNNQIVPPKVRVDDSHLHGQRRVRAIALLSPGERERFARDARPERFLAGRMLLRELASEFTTLPLASIAIDARCPDCGRQHGRPTITGTALFVSLSHADGLVVAALSDRAPIGIDIERRHASPERLAAIREITGGGDVHHWTGVEAVLKADGRGLRVDPRAVHITGGIATLESVQYALSDASERHRDDYVISVAVRLGVSNGAGHNGAVGER
jgi:4'-phosphopantetheinyl transferase